MGTSSPSVSALRSRVNGVVFRIRRGGGQLTVAQSWDLYARNRAGGEGLGDEWSNPSLIGMDVEPEQVVPHLVESYFRPFLGTPDLLVEIGAGGGRFTEPLLDFCGRVCAADTSKTMIRALTSRFENRSNCQPLLLDGTGLTGVASGSVDAVFSYGVFVHLQHWDFYNYIAETARVLRPGGKAIIQHANTTSEQGWARFLREVPASLNRHKLGGTFTVMTPELMSEFVTRAGLTLEACRGDIATRDSISFISKPSDTAQ